MANMEKLDAVMALVREKATTGEWDQGTYGRKTACGTAGCVAYWTAVHDGCEIAWDQIGSEWHMRGVVDYSSYESPSELIPDYARRVLGFDTVTATQFFAGYNNLKTLEQMTEVIREHGTLLGLYTVDLE